MTGTEVLIVGGGPAGLAMAALLARHEVSSVLVERRNGVNPHPRARSVNVRTAEIFRQLGILEAIEAVSLPEPWTRQLVYTQSLGGPEIGRTETTIQPIVDGRRVSPVPWLLSSQDQIEPIIRRVAEASDRTDIRFGRELVELEQADGGWRATVRPTGGDPPSAQRDGEAERIEASYVVGADGAGSAVRRSLDVALDGETDLATLVNCHFVADLDRWTVDRPAALYWTTNPARNVFQKIDTEHRWLCQIGYDRRHHHPSDFTPEVAAAWITRSVGVDDLDVRVIDVIPWTMSATVAERFAVDGAFLIGDAAHQLPPSGGFGMNTAVQDAHNLAWKLALVLHGRADPALLDSYHTERAPIARYNADRSLENTRNVGRIRRQVERGDDPAAVAAAVAAAGRYGNWLGMDLGLRYESGWLVPDGSSPPPVADPVSDYADTGRPGHRAPHVDLGGGRSTLDLYDRLPVVLVGAEVSPADREALATVHPDLAVHPLPVGDGHGVHDVHDRHGIDRTGAMLVRPDGHVAWRAATSASADRLAAAVDALGLVH